MDGQFFIALYAAILSTILAIIEFVREIKKNKVDLAIILTHITWFEYQEMTITNNGDRPVTIKEVGVKIKPTKEEMKNPDPFMSKPILPTYKEGEQNPLPIKLSKGDSINFTFNLNFDDAYMKDRTIAYAKDTNEKIYKTEEVRFHDGKYKYDMGDLRR